MRCVQAVCLLFSGLVLLAATTAESEVQSKTVEYTDGGVVLKGYFAWDDAVEGRRPGVVVAHEWWGLNDYARRRARMLAAMGYVAFALDMYGEGKATEHGAEAKAWMEQVNRNIAVWQRRALLGVEVLRQHDFVDPSRIAAIGYCFGGATVMQMAYSGADLKGIVSFHGPLPVATPEQAGAIKARILVEHGYDDPFVPAERIARFQASLDQADVDWEMDVYGGAQHSFTNPSADRYGIEGVHYDARADRRSWAHMRLFLEEIFGRQAGSRVLLGGERPAVRPQRISIR